jgi:hypothetical protein
MNPFPRVSYSPRNLGLSSEGEVLKRVGVVLLAGVLFMGLAGAEESCSELEATGEPSKTASVGQNLTIEGTTYRVNSAKTASSLGSGYFKEEANGVFVLVDLSLTNQKKEPATIVESMLTMIGGNGSEYSTSTDALLATDAEQLFILEDIQPGLTETGLLVYDVPQKAVKGSLLRVEDFLGSASGEIRLGL